MTSHVSSSVIGSSNRAVRGDVPAPSRNACRKGLGRDLFRAQTGQHQERRWVRRAQQGFEQAHAVRVGPVQVVDVQDERVPLCYPRQKIAQCRERQMALRRWLRILQLVARGSCHRLYLQHGGKHACQIAGRRRQERRRLR